MAGRPALYQVYPPVRVAWERRNTTGRMVHGMSYVTPVWMQDGLAVTPTLDYPGHYSVVHVGSCWTVVRDLFGQADAIGAARRFHELGDWDRGRVALLADRPFISAVCALRDQLSAEGIVPPRALPTTAAQG